MGFYRCLQAIAFDRPNNGGGSVLSPDQVVSSDDPMFEGRQDLFDDTDIFEPLDSRERRSATTLTPAVESATAAPGEKRSVSRPRRSAAGDER
jgi:hypothetical protein